jgi:hypothetical protein
VRLLIFIVAPVSVTTHTFPTSHGTRGSDKGRLATIACLLSHSASAAEVDPACMAEFVFCISRTARPLGIAFGAIADSLRKSLCCQ